MRHHLPPKGVLIAGGVLLVAWWYFRRRARAAELAATNANAGGIALSAIPASFTYLSSAAPAPTDRPIGAMSDVDAAALSMLQMLTTRLAGSAGGATSTSGGTVGATTSRGVGDSGRVEPWEAINTPSGCSNEAVQAAAARYAAGRSYGGAPYVPQQVVQEGTITTRNGVPGVMVKYATPGLGTSTEWTPLK
jgi:hypothetical protein